MPQIPDIGIGEGGIGEGEPGGTPIGPEELLKIIRGAQIRILDSEHEVTVLNCEHTVKIERSEHAVEIL